MKTRPSWRSYNPGVEEKAMIQIDDAGWGSLLSGVIIAGLRKETGEFAWREVPAEQFQGDNFDRRVYLVGAVNAAVDVLVELKHTKDESMKSVLDMSLRVSELIWPIKVSNMRLPR